VDDFPRWTPGWNHDQEHVVVADQEADIDIEIVSLIQTLWEVCIRTTGSCQDTPRFPEDGQRVWIAFENSDDASQFLEILSQGVNLDDELSKRIRKTDVNPLDSLIPIPERRNAWYFGASPVDLGIEVDMDKEVDQATTRIAPPEIAIEIDVWFPFSDVPEVERRLEAYLRSQ
jgi:hypothetical protein